MTGEVVVNRVMSPDSFIAALDMYVEDAGGGFEWAAPRRRERAFDDDVRASLELLDLHRFADGPEYLRYRCV